MVISLFSACQRANQRANLQDLSDQPEIPEPIASEEFAVPQYLPLRPQSLSGDARQVLSPLLQEFGAGGGPWLALIAPEPMSQCGRHVIVRGRVQGGAAPTEIDSLWWEILDTGHRGRIRYETDGSFQFAIPTLGLPRVFYLRIVAMERGGQSVERVVGLLAGSGLSSRKPIAPPEEKAPEEKAPEEKAEEARRAEASLPVLSLTTPGQDDYLSGALLISGQLLDVSGRAFPVREIESLTWEVEGSGLEGELETDEGGSFSTIVDAASVRQDSLLVLRAAAVTGRVAEQAVQLRADISAPKL